MKPALIQFEAACFERVWGGHRLREAFGMSAPENVPIGEAWLIADHATHVSTVLNGPWAGRSLHDVMVEAPEYLLGSHAKATVHGQFPLLLKILDAADVLSVQVHPDDAAAAALGEPDVGKTEMWHVLESNADSELICGLDPEITEETFRSAIADGTIQDVMRTFPAPPNTSVFVAAGTVHAIGAGIVLAEIQQNSDLTYRIYDWDRVDDAGNGRTLHLDKAARVTHFGSHHGGSTTALAYQETGGTVTVLAACRHFAAQLLEAEGTFTRSTGGHSFHLLLARDGTMVVSAGEETCTLKRGHALLVPAGVSSYTIEGSGALLCYYVPDLLEDIVVPLRNAGHSDATIAALGGDAAASDLEKVMLS